MSKVTVQNYVDIVKKMIKVPDDKKDKIFAEIDKNCLSTPEKQERMQKFLDRNQKTWMAWKKEVLGEDKIVVAEEPKQP